jgi:drug/metabolite transporter (DMT)-like permease
VLTQVAQLYPTKAYHAEQASKIAAFNYVGVFWAILFGVLFFGETLPIATLAGMTLILASVWMSTRKSKD